MFMLNFLEREFVIMCSLFIFVLCFLNDQYFYYGHHYFYDYRLPKATLKEVEVEAQSLFI